MATQTTSTGKARKAKKPPSPQRVAAMAAVETAVKQHESSKSPQEKTVTEERVKLARDALKALKFTEISRLRVRAVVKGLKRLENVANRSAYKWTDEQALKVSKVLTDALRRVTDRLTGTKETATDFDY